jgi:hypothetical protein
MRRGYSAERPDMAKKLGANYTFAKPFEREKLLMAVKNLLTQEKGLFIMIWCNMLGYFKLCGGWGLNLSKF